MSTLLYLTYAYPPPFDEGSINYQFNLIHNLKTIDTTVICPTRVKEGAEDLPPRPLQRIVRRQYMRHCRGFGLFWVLPLLFAEYLWAKVRGRAKLVGCGYIYPIGLVALLGKLLFGQKYFLFIYAEELPVWARRSRAKRFLMLMTLRFADQVITVSEYSIDVIREMFPYPREKIAKIIPAVRFPSGAKRAGAPEAPTLLTVGRLEERKGQDVTIRAMALLSKEFPTLTYVICGKGPDEARLRALVEELHLGDRVKFMGFVTEAQLQEHYKKASVFILANRELPNGDTEGCPTVLIEASAYGLPVIAGCFGGTADAVLNGLTGDIIDSTDPVAVAAAIRRLLTTPTVAEAYGKNGIEYALSCSPDAQGQKADLVLQRLSHV